MTRFSRPRGTAAAVLLCLSVLVVVPGSPAGAADHPADSADSAIGITGDDRELAGADRYETSVAVARQFVAAARAAGAPPTAVIVASGESLVDALSAVTLAAALGAPVVLTRAGTLPPSVRAFLAENPFSRVVVIGGTAAVSPAVEAALAAAAAVVERIAGADRFATATAIARRAGIAGDWCDSNQRAAVLVNGSRFADAVVIAPLAYALNLPVLLTDADALPAETARYLADAGIERVVVVGGTAAVSTTTAAATVAAGVSGITRLAGADRYETSVEVVRAIGGCGVEQRDPDSVAFVNGTATADGVVAGPLLGLGLGGNGVTPILLVDADEIPSAVRRWLVTGWPATTSGVVIIREIVPVGGTAVVSDAVVTTAQLLVGPRPQKDEPRQSGAAGGSSPARTGPVVRVTAAAGGHSFEVAVDARGLADDEVLVVGDFAVTPNEYGFPRRREFRTKTSLAAPAALIPAGGIGVAGGTVCLFGVDPAGAGLPADRQTCVAAGSAAQRDAVFTELDEITVDAAALRDAAGSLSVETVYIVPDTTPPTVRIIAREGRSEINVNFADAGLAEGQQIEVAHVTLATGGGPARPLSAVAGIINRGSLSPGGGTVCLDGPDPDNAIACASPAQVILAEGDVVTVAAGAVADTFGLTNAATFVVIDTTAPVVTLSRLPTATHQFDVSVVELHSSDGAAGRVDIGEIIVDSQISGRRYGLAAPSVVIPAADGSGGGRVCLFGRAGPGASTCATDAAGTGVRPLAERDQITVYRGAVVDLYRNESVPSAAITIGDVTPPAITIPGVGSSAFRFSVVVAEENPAGGAAGRVDIGEVTRRRVLAASAKPLGPLLLSGALSGAPSPSAVIRDGPGASVTVCLFGIDPDTAARPAAQQACEDGGDDTGVEPLAVGEWLQVAAGAVTDVEGNVSSASNFRLVGDDARPDIFFGPLTVDYRFYLTVDEDNPGGAVDVEDGRITLDEIHRDGVDLSPPSAIIYNPTGTDPGGGWVCLFGIDPDTAAMPAADQTCETDPDPADPVAPLAVGDFFGIDDGALIDTSGARSSSVSLRVAADFSPPTVEILLAERNRHELVVIVRSANLDTAGSAIEGSSVTFRAKTTSTAVPTATAFSAVVLLAGTAARTVAGAPAGIERTLCLLGLADGTPTPPASPCKAGSADDAPVPGDAFIVAGAIAGDTSNRRNRETVLVFADTTPPVVTLFLRENTSFVHLFYVGITEQYRAAGAAGRVDIGDFVRDGVPLAAPSAVLYDLSGRNDGGGTVCLFGIGSGRGGCVYNAGNTGVAPLADGEEIAALQGAVHDASGNPSARSDSVVVVDATGPEVSIRFLADSRNQLRVVVVEERPRSGSTIVAAEILRSVNGEERAPLGAPVEVYALPRDTAKNEQEFVVCLFGFAAGATDACSTDSTVAGSRALFQQDRFWVVVGAVYDSFDNPNREETGPVDGPDLTDPSVTVVLTANTNHQFVVTVHEEGSFPADADNRQVDIVEISRRGPAADAVATDLGAPSEIIPDGAAGGTVCLFGIDPATADLPAADQTCETRPLDPSDSGYVAPLSAGEVIVVGSGAVVDSAAKENDASASDAVGDVTLPVVTLAFDEENEYVLVISVTGASAGAVIAADRLFFNASPYTDTWSTAAADSGFTVVCLLGAAGPVVSAADCRTSADASPSAARLAPGDRFVILGGSVTDDAGNGNLEVVRAVAVAVVRVETVANADDRFVVYVEIAGGTGDYSSIPLEHITRGRPGRAATPLAAPSQFQSDSGVSRLLCLFGIDPATARLRPADRTCETDPGDVNDPDYVQPLSAGEVIRVLAGAIDSNEAASATVGDVTPPDVFVNFVGGNVHHFVVSVEETMLLEGQEIVAAEVLRGGVVDAHFVVERRSRNRWWVCVFGLTAGVVPDAAVNPDSPCATADPDGAGGATALTTGEEISVVTGAILDAAGNRSGSETGPFLVPDVVPPVVSVRLADGAGQTARFFVDVDESHPGRGELGRVVPGEIARDGVALGAPTAIIYDVSGSNPGGGEVCLFGITRASGTARCVTEVDALVAPLAEGSTLIVPGGALEDAGGAVSLASASVTVDFDFPPVLTVGISRGERAWFSVYVAEAIGLDAVGAAAGTPADVLSANELFVDGSRLTSPPVVVRNVGTGARAGLDWRVCLFGTVRGACRTQAGDAGGKAIKTGDTILVVAGALEDAAGNPSVAVTFTVPEYTPPVLNPKLQAGGARAGDDKVRFTLVEPNLASGSAVTVAEVKIRRGGNRLDLPDSANIVTARGIVIVCLLGLIPGHIANCIPFDGDAGNVAALTQVGDQYFVEHGAVCDVYGACSHESRPYVVTGDYRIPVPYVRAVAGQEYFEIGWVGPLGQPPANLSSTPHTIGVGEFSAQGRSTGAGLLYISQTDDGRLIRVCLFGVVDGSASRSPCKTADPNEGATPNLLAVGDVIVVNAGALANPAGTGSDELTYTVGTSPGAVNTAPVILTSAALGFDESSGEHRVTTLVATDADNDGLTWTKTGGADTVRLGVSTAGLLSFEDLPDFENPRDADRNNVYEVTVTVTDDGTPPLSAELAVRVTVLNADEAGTVRIMPLTVPRVGDVLTASVTDIDGSAADPAADGPAAADTTWQWERSTGTGYAPISGARAAAYTVMPFDAGKTLRAKAVYTDGHGAGKTGNAATATVPVEAVLSVVGDPVFTGAPPDGRGVTTLKVGDTLVLTVSAEQALAADSLADAVTVFAVSSVLVTLDLVAVAGAANTYRATYTVAAGHRVGRGDLAMNIAVRGTDGNALARFYRSFPGVVVDAT